MKIVKYIFEAFFVYFLFFVIKLLGINFGRKVSAFIFLNVGSFFRPKTIIEKNISYALKGINKSDIKKIIASMWKNYGFVFAEYLFMKKFRLNKFSKPHIVIKGKEILDDIQRSGQPAIFVSGHFANFELMAMEIEKNDINLAAIYRPLNNFLINPFMEAIRKKYICKRQIKKGLSGIKKVIENLQNNNSIALMVDQRLGESERYPFFDRPAHTTTLPAQMALKFKCKIIPIYLERDNDNLFTMEIYKPITFENTGDQEIDKKNITVKINKIIENMIKRNPGQWIWTHGRWK